jgi:hypothetical protein
MAIGAAERVVPRPPIELLAVEELVRGSGGGVRELCECMQARPWSLFSLPRSAHTGAGVLLGPLGQTSSRLWIFLVPMLH